MPRHLISDAHERINKIPTVPIYYLAKPQQRERTLHNQRGKEDPVELDSSLADLVKRHEKCRISGSSKVQDRKLSSLRNVLIVRAWVRNVTGYPALKK